MKRYSVSKYFKFILLLIVFSATFLILYLVQMHRYRFPTEVTAQNVRSLKRNQYVRITMDQYLAGKENVSGDTSTMTGYVSYMVCIGDSAYLPVGFKDKELLTALESYSHGHGDQISFIGRVVKWDPSPEANYAWYYRIYENFDADLLVKDTVIYQLNEKEVQTGYKILFMIGGIGMTVALLLFFTVGGICVTYARPFEESKRYKECVLGKINDLEDELRKEKRALEELRQEQKETKKRILLGAGLFIGGILIIVVCFVLAYVFLQMYFAVGIYLGMYVMCMGVKWLWYAFINSDLLLAKKISELFLIRSYSVRIEESIKIVSALKKRLWESQEKEQKTVNEKMGEKRESGQGGRGWKEDLSWLRQDD